MATICQKLTVSQNFIMRKKAPTGIKNKYQVPRTNNKKRSLKRNDIDEEEEEEEEKDSDGDNILVW